MSSRDVKLQFITKPKTAYIQNRIRVLPPEGATRCTILYLGLFETIQHQKANIYKKELTKARLPDVLNSVIRPTLAIQNPNSVATEERLHRLSYGKKSDSRQPIPAKMPHKNR